MPIAFYQVHPQANVSLWKITESIEELRQMMSAITDESACEADFKLESSVKEWMASRLALAHLLPPSFAIYRKENKGLGLLNSALNVSVSHTKGYAAAIVSRYKCGVDVEIVGNRIARIAHKFVGQNEQWAMDIEELYQLWGAKETMYKIDGHGGLDFKKQLEVSQPLEKKVWVGEIRKQPNGIKCVLYKKQTEQALLVWGIESSSLIL